MKKLSFYFISLFLVVCAHLSAQETVEIFPNIMSQKKLKLSATFLSQSFRTENPEDVLTMLENAIDKYGINILNAHGFSSDAWITYRDYEKLRKNPDMESINQYRNYYRRLKEKGVYLVIGGGEPVAPLNLFVNYPEMKQVNNQLFWRFIENKTMELYDIFPEMDCFEIYLWETPLVDDFHVFDDLTVDINTGYPYYSQSDYFKQFFDALSRAAHSRNKDFMLLTFSHFPYQEQIMIEALENRDRNYPFLLDHKCQPGDWTPVKPVNNILKTVTDMPAQLQFDGAGEYWGQSLIPFCYPEEIQARLQHALKCNPNIHTLNMRVNWQSGSLFGKPNEINFYALSKLAEDPFTPIEKIWKDWATERFGEKPADKVISALKRTDDIGRNIFYIEGIWVFNHSALAGLSYVESHMVNYARCTAQLKPDDFMGNYKMNELLNYPREYLIREIMDDRDEALRLNALSLQDIEDVRGLLKPDDYQMLKEQLTRQRDMARASKLHLEVFFRYRIEKLKIPERGENNRKKLEICLAHIEEMAMEFEQKYSDGFPFLHPSLLREYAEQVRMAIGI